MNTNLDDVENLLRNLMLSLGHASEILPPHLSLVKAEKASRAKQIEHLLQATNIEPIVLAPFLMPSCLDTGGMRDRCS